MMPLLELQRRWAALSQPARTAFAAAAVLACAGAIAFALLGRESSVPLFSTPLHAEQLAEVTARLADWNVAYVSGSDNVRVDARRRNELLLRLSLAGVPHTHVEGSSERLDRLSALTPQSVLEAQTRNGLADDLAVGLRGISGIADARVIIAPARPGIFAGEPSADASASVRITRAPGARLSDHAVAGIRAFVAAGVPGLAPQRVAIVDDRGVALSDPGMPGGAAADADAGDVQTSLQSALDAAFGPETTIVRVRADLDPRERSLHEVHRSALAGPPIEGSTESERYANEKRQYVKTHRDEQRGTDLREERTMLPAGHVARLSIAIFVDAERRGTDVEKIRRLATAAAGLQSARGDALTVEAVRFSRPSTAATSSPVREVLAALLPGLPVLCVVVAVGLALRFAARPLATLATAVAQRATVRETRAAVAGYAPSQVRGALRGEPPHTAAAVISALPTATAAAVLELYAPEERAAIVRRLSRPASPLMPDCELIVGPG